MNLNKSLRALIVDRFKTGAGIKEIADWYGQKPERIEDVIRKAMNGSVAVEDMQQRLKLAGALGELKLAIK